MAKRHSRNKLTVVDPHLGHKAHTGGHKRAEMAQEQWTQELRQSPKIMQSNGWFGIGAWWFAIFLSIAPSVWPQTFKSHPYLVIGLGVIGFLCFLMPVFQHLWKSYAAITS